MSKTRRHPRVSKSFEGTVSRTKQEFREESNINNIMAKYEKHGVITHIKTGEPVYGDFSGLTDYQTSLNTVMAAQDVFDSLPAKLRKRFSNDPAEMVRFVEDPANADELVELGMAKKPAKTKVDAAEQQSKPVKSKKGSGEAPKPKAEEGA